MGDVMARKQQYLLNRDGRFFARLVVPKDLRAIVGKTEIREALGPDRRTATKLLPGAIAKLQHEIAQAERQAGQGRPTVGLARYPLALDQIALSHYQQRLAFDTDLRNDWRYASFGYIDTETVSRLRDGVAGKLTDAELQALVGEHVERFRAVGNLDAAPGSDEWRGIARAICASELEVQARSAERDNGDFTGQPVAPVLVAALQQQDEPEPVGLAKLLNDYIKARTAAGFMKDKGRRAHGVIEDLRKFLKHSDARKVTKKDLLEWRDHLLTRLAAKTVNDVYLSAVRSLFLWAHENERLPENVAGTVKQPKPKRQRTREAGYTDAEAVTVLKASRSYMPKEDEFGRVRETPESVSAKRWVPLICAFTGARVSEITQLRKEDVRQEGDRWVLRITPEAGTMKAGHYRDVPVHHQIVSEGFVQFVEQAGQGPLFHNGTDPAKFAAKAQRMSNQIADWLRLNEIKPEGVQPSHAWRHRFKTLARDLGADMRVVDAIQGHAGRTASDEYGDVSLIAKARVIDSLPVYPL